MDSRHLATLLGATFLATACASKNAAPVTYGSNPASSARVYTSKSEILAEQREAAAARDARLRTRRVTTPPPAAAPSSSVAAVQLAPIAAGDVPDPGPARQRYDYDARPVYISQPAVVEVEPEPLTVGSTEPLDVPSMGPSTGVVIVERGDTVYAISRKTGASPQEIIALNGFKAPYTLEVGQRVRVPSSYRQAEAAAPATASVSVQTPAAAVTRAAEAKRLETDYRVRPGDTLYSIARRTGADVTAIAKKNALRPPYALTVGQVLAIPQISLDDAIYGSAPQQREAAAAQNDAPQPVAYTQPVIGEREALFSWPVKGAILDRFGAVGGGKRNDGVNIAAPVGTPVRAAADGEVVYRGSELEGYGNLLLIKHADGFVTAYAHNDVMLVRKGQTVRKGEVIAKVGQSGSAEQPQLHFEIRQNLKAVDPIAFLGS